MSLYIIDCVDLHNLLYVKLLMYIELLATLVVHLLGHRSLISRRSCGEQHRGSPGPAEDKRILHCFLPARLRLTRHPLHCQERKPGIFALNASIIASSGSPSSCMSGSVRIAVVPGGWDFRAISRQGLPGPKRLPPGTARQRPIKSCRFTIRSRKRKTFMHFS